jgi:branched-chain amino acid transport system permease protein
MQFFIHIIISAIIFTFLASGFKLFINLKGNLDFSYMAIVIFSSYVCALLNLHYGRGMFSSFAISFFFSLVFTFFILLLSKRLNEMYFMIGTFTLYMLVYQLAYNLEPLTGGALGLGGIQRILIGNVVISDLSTFLWWIGGAVVVVIALLWYLKTTSFYKILMARAEREIVIKSLGLKVSRYKLGLILLSTLLASVAGMFYTFYYLYIDPSSFWFATLILALVIVLLSYKWNDIGTLCISLVILFIYEYLRFFKLVEASKIGYVREMLFGAIIMLLAFFFFRKVKFTRER